MPNSLPIIYAIMVFVLSACATAANGSADLTNDEPKGVEVYADDPRLGEKLDRLCFVRDLSGFSYTTEDTVVFDITPSRGYIVEVRSGCDGLDRAKHVRIDAASSCAGRGDRIIVSEAGRNSGLSKERCFINSIHAWTESAAWGTSQ